MAVWGPAVAEELRRDVRFAHVQGRQESATANRHRARHGCGRNHGPHQTVQLEGRRGPPWGGFAYLAGGPEQDG